MSKSADFKAWINKQPPNNVLHVKGSVEVSTSGWMASLYEAVPQGINPNILILVLTLTPPAGQVLQVISSIPVDYEQNPARLDYESVTIRTDKGEFSLDVDIVR